MAGDSRRGGGGTSSGLRSAAPGPNPPRCAPPRAGRSCPGASPLPPAGARLKGAAGPRERDGGAAGAAGTAPARGEPGGAGGCQAGGERGSRPVSSSTGAPAPLPRSLRRYGRERGGKEGVPPRGFPVGSPAHHPRVTGVPGVPAVEAGQVRDRIQQEGGPAPPDCPHRPLSGSPSAPRAETWQLMALPALGTGGGIGNGTRAAPESPGEPLPGGGLFSEVCFWSRRFRDGRARSP